MCLWTRRPSLCARAVDAQVRVSSCFCRCTKDLAGFIVTYIIFTSILRILRHVIAQLPHGLQLTPMIAAVSRIHRGVHDWLLVHALLHLSMAAGGLLRASSSSSGSSGTVARNRARGCAFCSVSWPWVESSAPPSPAGTTSCQPTMRAKRRSILVACRCTHARGRPPMLKKRSQMNFCDSGAGSKSFHPSGKKVNWSGKNSCEEVCNLHFLTFWWPSCADPK